ncbi:alpha/beta fold hydrolase [Nocardioides stalactiti]|uniref:alpha/beta fold hydrolase n=1 Tax=Nocardioides stalactiti TaxID=2755356 RepID=UPI0016041193|nr:alpha/beta hydrolase [Nocardioides stalactiti]
MTTVTRRRARYGDRGTRSVTCDGVGPTVVLLHGFADSADTWNGVVDRLAAAGVPAVAVDLPGFGEADDLEAGDVLPQLDEFVAWVVESHRHPHGVVLVGNSLGALASLRAACQGVPVLGVVTLAEPACGDSWLIRRFRRRRPSLLVQALGTRLPLPSAVSSALTTAAAGLALGPAARRQDPAAARRLGDYLARRGGTAWAVRTSRALALETEDCYRFAEVTCPVLVVHGARDWVIPVNAAKKVHASIPHSRMLVEPRWGHCPQIQDPAGVTGLIRGFLHDIAAAEPGHGRAG